MHFLGDMQGVGDASYPHCRGIGSQEERSLREFNWPCDGSPGTFEALLGGRPLDSAAMDALSVFIFSLSYPPNPIRPLNNRTNRAGEKIFTEKKTLADVGNLYHIVDKGPLIFRCIDCHSLNRQANLYGTSKKMYSAPSLTLQDAKVPHLRFLYDRVGFFRGDYRTGSHYRNLRKTSPFFDQVVHGIGYNHGGWFDTTMFFASDVWITNPSDPQRKKQATIRQYEDLFKYLMEFDSNYFPMYGKQLTVDINNGDVLEKIQALDSFFRNAFQPEDAETIQCGISYMYGGESEKLVPQRSVSYQEINNYVDDILRISALNKLPVTLTCI
jgi:hypothetical protein